MTRYSLSHTLSKLYAGHSIARILMNTGLAQKTIAGLVVDVGGARHPDYFDYLQSSHDTRIEPLDGMLSGINFETDPLPYADGAVDTVLMCNLLEHMYNHRFLLGETYRILKHEGTLVGFVPFWVGYHPDPHDYFRYTPEALEKLLTEAGFIAVTIQAIGGGPLMANFNTIGLSMPRILRPVVYLWYAFFDLLYLKLRPKSKERNPLGFIFTATHA